MFYFIWNYCVISYISPLRNIFEYREDIRIIAIIGSNTRMYDIPTNRVFLWCSFWRHGIVYTKQHSVDYIERSSMVRMLVFGRRRTFPAPDLWLTFVGELSA